MKSAILVIGFPTVFTLVSILINISTGIFESSEVPIYKNPEYSMHQRVEDLISRMTLEEKIGQLNMPSMHALSGHDAADRETAEKLAAGQLLSYLGPVGGFFTLASYFLHEGPLQQADTFNELQRTAVERTRLGIPLLITEEGTHGLMATNGTIFPEGLAIGSSWNVDLVEEIYATAAREARAIGVHQLMTLVIEPIRDPRLGRNIEAYAECAYLTSRIAEAIVRGTQGVDLSAPDRVVAGLAHFPGQSEPLSGMERGEMEISERKLREVFLPPWKAAIKSGALGLMATYPALDGIPVHGCEKTLTKLLREELGFQGVVLSEGYGLDTLIYEGIVATQKEAGALALKAGVDISIYFEEGYLLPLIENVRAGKVHISTVDRAVRRILGLKFRLGLFESPYVDREHAVSVSNSDGHREVALRAAREGIVLLKNDNNLLPLRKNIDSVAVIGPNANNGRNQLGDYVARFVTQDVVTVLDGIREKVSPETSITYVKGCEVIGTEFDDIEEARMAAAAADVAIVVLGESAVVFGEDGKFTTGEAYDVVSLDLTGHQEKLLKAVHSTGTPTVVVLVNGRPLSIRWAAEHVPAIVEAWMCGERGGHAVADVLFGDYNPSGRLAITILRHSGQLPIYYNYKPSRRYWMEQGWAKPYVDMSPLPLYEFGLGLSYTTYEYGNLRIVPKELGPAGDVEISVDVENTGGMDGVEVVQLYINDVISSVTTPVKELRGFERVHLKAGERRTVTFRLVPEDLALWDRNFHRVVEPGLFEVMIGSSAEKIRLRGEFRVN
jgi:beta-glucosidase